MPRLAAKKAGTTGAAKKVGADDLIRRREGRRAHRGSGSFSIDQQRYNFQFGGQVFHEIKNGKKARCSANWAYQARTPRVWASRHDVGAHIDLQLGRLVPSNARGQPTLVECNSSSTAGEFFAASAPGRPRRGSIAPFLPFLILVEDLPAELEVVALLSMGEAARSPR